MREWLEGLESRERIMLTAGAAALALFLVYLLVWQPLHSGYDRLRDNVTEQRATALWMQQSAQRLVQLRSTAGRPGGGLAGRSLLSVADSTARAAGLGPALKRVEPEGSSSVRVWLEGASFDELVKWLGTLSNHHGIDVDSATMERTEAAGRINARLTLQAASP